MQPGGIEETDRYLLKRMVLPRLNADLPNSPGEESGPFERLVYKGSVAGNEPPQLCSGLLHLDAGVHRKERDLLLITAMPQSPHRELDSIRRNTTMADVAQLAGVGKMTVSRFLSGSANVSKATAERVQRAIRMLNYQPNELARSLRSVHSKTIALILPYLYDPFFATCAHAISTVATQHGYSVLITTSDERTDVERKQASLMLRRRIDGMIIIPAPHAEEYLRDEMFSHTHIVTLDRPAPDLRFDSVVVNNRTGARAGVTHLIEHGHRKIAFLGLSKLLFTFQARYAGYKEAMTRGGLVPENYIDCVSQESTITTLHSLLTDGNAPTALFAGNNLTMRYMLHALSVLRIDVPGKIALAGFDDFDIADVLQPALTVVRQPVYQIGETAANLLFERISRGQFPTKGHRVVLPLELVIRRSCGCHATAGDDRNLKPPAA
jgi:LacI family transcriptional regulator